MHDLRDAASQAWPPFVLVAGLLMIGAVAHGDGMFERAGRLVGAIPGPPVVALFGCMALVAVVTATMNLDSAAVFLTPVLILVARRRSLDERPFLYAALFMANASSLFLPGSNLTNLLVLGRDPAGGSAFASGMLAPAAVATITTAIGIWLMLGRQLGGRQSPGVPDAVSPGARFGSAGLIGVVVAAVLTVVLRDPAIPVLGVGLAVAIAGCVRGVVTPATVARAVGPAVLAGLFALSVALGVLARSWDGPSTLIAGAGQWATVAIAAVASVTVNNLPAAVLLSAHHVPHARALLVGLNLGPNLAVTGSLSSYLWFRAARQVGAEPSVAQVTRIGVVLAPAAIVLATLALSLNP